MKALLIAAAVVALAGCAATSATSPPPASPASLVSPAPTPTPAAGPLQVSDPGKVTGTLTGPCHTAGGGQLPDPSCTPGAYDPAVTAAVLCAPGYSTASYRPPSSQTTAFKYRQAYPAYGITGRPVSELDHLISLELGGGNDAANLWPEIGPIPNPKDTVENALHKWVCAATGQAAETRLHDAQAAIAADWMTAEQRLGI